MNYKYKNMYMTRLILIKVLITPLPCITSECNYRHLQ